MAERKENKQTLPEAISPLFSSHNYTKIRNVRSRDTGQLNYYDSVYRTPLLSRSDDGTTPFSVLLQNHANAQQFYAIICPPRAKALRNTSTHWWIVTPEMISAASQRRGAGCITSGAWRDMVAGWLIRCAA
ncbi:hypothetical protein BaRGS_00009047 [Batillaria attramentaria]|uniref:Uncharacterized protein n=1 Tax=Batillaria attramentaria TaxID=370345 RepID=A0ABD0LJL9_9CAEN